MSKEKDGRGFPKIAKGTWFSLRDKLKQRVPAEISASYVAGAMGMTPDSARANVIAPLRALGIIEEDGRPSELAYDWRDDEKYPEVCKSIVETVYPQELRDLFHDPSANQESVTSWFMRTAKVGEAAAKMFARTYLMLLEGDPSKREEVSKPSKPKAARIRSEAPKKSSKSDHTTTTLIQTNPQSDQRHSFVPRLHIDVQVHISPDSSPEQIDKIFEAMAKHLSGFKS